MDISIVVPVYNSHDTLDALMARVETALSQITARFEVILVNDGSRDASWQKIEALARANPRARGLNLMRNFGQHNALLCGIRAARGAVIVTIDDDLQNPPEEIHKLLKTLNEGFDVVYGAPQREQHGLWRDLASQFTKIAMRSAMGTQNARNISAFRAFKTQLRDAFANFQGANVSIDVLLTWGTAKFGVTRVQHDARAVGASNYNFGKLVRHAINMMTGFSVMPLQLASMVGFAFTIIGILVLLFVVGRYIIEGGSVPGFPFLASAIAIFSGVQLFALGIIGEYLARMYLRLMDRPAYVVRDDTQNKS